MSIGRAWEGVRHAFSPRDSLDDIDYAGVSEESPGAMQEFKDQCDINNIMARFQRSGALDWANKHEGTFADVTGYGFQSAMDTIQRAQQLFDDLPSSVRDRFHNDPSSFLDFIHNPNNHEEATRLGLTREAMPIIPEKFRPAGAVPKEAEAPPSE